MRWLVIVAGLALAACEAEVPVPVDEPTSPTTVVLVRHAEKESTPDDPNPALSAAGAERADLLARMFGDAPVAAAYATEYERTQATLRPLAAARGIDVTIHPAADFDGLATAILSGHVGGTVLVAGHSNTVPSIIEALGAGPVDPIDESVYDNLYIVTVAAGSRPSVLQLRYGAPLEPVP